MCSIVVAEMFQGFGKCLDIPCRLCRCRRSIVANLGIKGSGLCSGQLHVRVHFLHPCVLVRGFVWDLGIRLRSQYVRVSGRMRKCQILATCLRSLSHHRAIVNV